MKKYILFIFSILAISLSSCDMLDLNNKLDDPNNLTASQADINYVLTATQVNLVNLTAGQYINNQQGLNISAMQACRMIHMFGAYTGPFSQMNSTSTMTR